MQLKFWLQMKDYIQEHPDSAVAKVYNMGSQTSPYIKYYEKLENENTEPKECKERIKTEYLERYKRKMTSQLNDDPDSKLGTYLRSNPNLTSNVPVPQTILESERQLLTRFRTGSHSLAIEIGRYANVTRENRLCRCSAGVQTVWHVFTECHLTRDLVQLEYNSLDEIFDDENVNNVLLAITKKLKIQIW